MLHSRLTSSFEIPKVSRSVESDGMNGAIGNDGGFPVRREIVIRGGNAGSSTSKAGTRQPNIDILAVKLPNMIHHQLQVNVMKIEVR